MSMYESAEKLNQRIKEQNFTEDQINTMIWFGSVAKFRCRSNIAYKNFVTSTLNGMADVFYEQIPGRDFEVLKAKVNPA